MSSFVDLPGRDISPPMENSTTTPRLLKTVVISVMKEGGDIEYAIAPLRSSYSRAVETAVEVLGDLLEDIAPNTVCLKMAAKNSSGESIWASISPPLWDEIVSEGTELRIFSKSTPTTPIRVADHSATYSDRPTITIKLPASSAKDDRARYLTMLVPKSYDETRKLAFNKLKGDFKTEKSSWEHVILRGLIEEKTQEGALSFETFISTYGTGESLDWERLIIRMKKEYPRFKVLLY